MCVQNAKQLEAAVRCPDRIKAAQTVFEAMALVETVKPIVRGYETEILKLHQWRTAPEYIERGRPDQIILDPDQSDWLSDADFGVFAEECIIARKKSGLYVEREESCPLLVAEHLLLDAKHALIDIMEPVTGIKYSDLWRVKNYDNCVDLYLNMFAPLVDSKAFNDKIKA